MGELRDRLEAGMSPPSRTFESMAPQAPRLPNIANVALPERIRKRCSRASISQGVSVSAGSACTSGALEPSHVIAALGTKARPRDGAIRFSLGVPTTAAEIERVLAILPAVVAAVRRSAPTPA